MKIRIYLMLLIILLFSCKSIHNIGDMRDKVFFYHIGVVENFVNVGYIDDDSILRCSVEFLEKLTQVKSKAIEQRDFFYNPSKQNIKDWKKWFRKNKESLYWDENEHKLKLLRTQSSLL